MFPLSNIDKMISMLRLLAFTFIIINTLSVNAITIPQEIKQKMFAAEPGGDFRFDGIYQKGTKNWLLILKDLEKKNEEPEILELEVSEKKTTAKAIVKSDLLDKENQDYLFYGQEKAYLYTPIKENTIKSFKQFSPELQKEILSFTISPEFLIPAGFSITRDLATISGELPIQFRTIELATDKEEVFRKLVKQQEENHLNFLTYSDKNKHFHLYTLNKKEKTVTDKDLGSLLKKNSEKFYWLNHIKKDKDKVYISDYSSGKIYNIKVKELLEKDPEDLDLEIFVDLSPILERNGLLDFNIEHNNLYFLSQKNSRFFSVNLKNNKIIKSLKLPQLITEMEEFDYLSNESKNLVVNSRGTNELNFVSTANYQITHSINYKQKNSANFIHDFEMNKDVLLTASEIHHHNGGIDGKVLIYSSVSKTLDKEIPLDFIPKKILFLDNDKSALVLGDNDEKSYLAKINLVNTELNSVKELDMDLYQSEDMLLINQEKLLVIAGKLSPVLVFLDTENFEALKKLETKYSYNTIMHLD